MASDNSCCKYLMFVVNLLIFLSGAALLGVGIWAVTGAESFRNLVSDDPRIFNAVYIIIAVGALLLVVGFLGCCGAIKENKCMLATFFALVLVLFILEIVGGVLAFVFYPDARRLALESMEFYGTDGEEGQSITAAWDELQTAFSCCGLAGSEDWLPAIGFIPTSCQPLVPLPPGCEETIQNYFWVLGGIALGVLVIELLAMVFACCLYRGAGKDRYA